MSCPFDSIKHKLRSASVDTAEGCLRLSTGRVERILEWTRAGLVTTSFGTVCDRRVFKREGRDCDWQLPNGRVPSNARLVGVAVSVSDDERFTSEHLRVQVEISYDALGIGLRWEAWIYPGAAGFRTQLSARLLREQVSAECYVDEIAVESLPAWNSQNCRRRFFGYYNNTQKRNSTFEDLLKESVSTHPLTGREWCDWASVACYENAAGGYGIVKESHKCVNQPGHITGGFVCDETEGLLSTGWGLDISEVCMGHWTQAWAHWVLCWEGGDFERSLAFKTFDRLRYPPDVERDLYIQANTWGSQDEGVRARRAAGEISVLHELEVCSELGIDVLQIDDGWQGAEGELSWDPGDRGWKPHPDRYPDGWCRIVERAEELGLKLGLWAGAMEVSLEELEENYEKGKFVQFKLDFADLKSRESIDALMQKVRTFIQSTGHRVRVNWDVTENEARYGYFFAREFGCIYLENRKAKVPRSTIYKPHTVLRDLWQLARYLNLNRFQCSIQNVEQVDSLRSDAGLHSHSYAVAIALMGVPLFFLETKYYSKEARAEIGQLLAVYRKVRKAIFHGIVHPIGSPPDNASWTGFQCHLEEEGVGFLMVFRERCNVDVTNRLRLGWLESGSLVVDDLMTHVRRQVRLSDHCEIELNLEAAGSFLFLQYGASEGCVE